MSQLSTYSTVWLDNNKEFTSLPDQLSSAQLSSAQCVHEGSEVGVQDLTFEAHLY